jgi:hypothetical protein
MKITLDSDTPIFKSLEIKGSLTFLNNGTDITLNAGDIWVHEGKLLIGNETHPFEGIATIKLHGNSTNGQFSYFENLSKALII